jgi:hypothetical protein
MTKPLSCLLPSLAAVVLSLGMSAPARAGHDERGCAILSPVDCPDPPGFNSANGDIDKRGGFIPYYNPLIPVSVRWRYCYLVPYYCGYCRWCSTGCSTEGCCGAAGEAGAAGTYGVFTGARRDDALFGKMGGNGLVPYCDGPPPRSGPPDIIDMIEAGRGHPAPGCP